jgi:hypothetical protein
METNKTRRLAPHRSASPGRSLPLFALLLLPVLLVLAFAVAASAASAKPEPQFTFAVIGDRTDSAVEDIYERVLDEASQLGPDLIVTVGDHIEGYTADSALVEQEWNEFTGMIERTGIQYHLTPGNHDIWDPRSEAIFKRRFGAGDNYFRFMNTVFIILDVSGFSAADALPKEKIDWLKRVLEIAKTSKGIFIFYHKPFWCEDFSSGRANLLHEIFKGYPVKAVFTGHYHRYFHTVRDGIQYFGVSSSGASLPPGGREMGAFYSYLLARVRGDSVSVVMLEPGVFTPIDIVTFDDALKMAEVGAKSVEISELLAYDYKMSGSGGTTVTVENLAQATLSDTAQWILRGSWAVQPIRDYVEVPPGDTGKLNALVRCDGPLFPVPVFEIHVPCCGGRTIEVAKPLNVKRVIFADFARSAPVIDGDLTDAAWRQEPGESNFFGPQGGETKVDSTVLMIRYDASNLYLGVECFDSDMESLHAAVKDRDAFAADEDAVTFLFEPARQSDVFFQITVNPLGTLFDRRVEVCPFGTYIADPRWDVPAQVKTSIGSGRWVVEAAFPLAALRAGAAGESRWGFNFTRVQQRVGMTANFEPPFRYRSDSIGLLGFR